MGWWKEGRENSAEYGKVTDTYSIGQDRHGYKIEYTDKYPIPVQTIQAIGSIHIQRVVCTP